jgi:hypothetical protein
MTPEQARALAQQLNDAADQAEAEGRDLVEADLDRFATLDDVARETLAAAIESAQGR